MKKKICFYFNSMNQSGGVERVITNLINNLIKYYDITILVKDDCKVFYSLNKNVKISTIDSYLDFDMKSKFRRIFNVFSNTFTSIIRLKRHFRENEYDYVYTATPLDSFQVYFSLKNKQKIVVSEHASRDAYNLIYKKMREYVYPKVLVVSVPTTIDTHRYKADGYKSVYIPHLTTFSSTKCLQKKEKIVLNVGRLTNDKQQSLLIDIWKKVLLKRDVNDWKLLIIGDGELYDFLNNKIINLGLQENCILLNATPSINEYYEKASIFAFSSKMEGYGMVLTEAMSYGAPCISFDCPSGPRDIISSGEDGFLIDCFDIDEYVRKLYLLIKDNDKRAEFYQKSLEKIDAWDNSAILKKWCEIFK